MSPCVCVCMHPFVVRGLVISHANFLIELATMQSPFSTTDVNKYTYIISITYPGDLETPKEGLKELRNKVCKDI